MAETVRLYLKLNGTDIVGESTGGSIECTSLAFDVEKDGSEVRTGEIKVAAPIDKAEPLIMQGLVQGQTAEGVFKFFRPNPTGDGTTEQFFTIWGKSGRVTAAQMWVPDTISPASSTFPPMMQYAFSFSTIDETYTNGGITVEWS